MKKITLIRRITQIVSFMLIFYGAYLLSLKPITIEMFSFGGNEEGLKADKQSFLYQNPLHTQPLQLFLPVRSCRFAGITGAFRGCILFFLSDSLTWLKSLKVFLPHFLLFIFLAFIFGRLWCGWICPMGFISEILSEIRKKIGWQRIKFSPKFKKIFRLSGYTALGLILLISLIIAIPQLPWSLRKPFYLPGCQICPARMIVPLLTGFPLIINLYSPILITLFSFCLLFTGIFLSGFFFKRWWCKLCPNGVLLSFFNKGGLITKEKNSIKCTRCGICADACPMETKLVYEEKNKKNYRNFL